MKYYKTEDVFHRFQKFFKAYAGWEKSQLKIILDDIPTIDIVRCKECKYNPKYTKDFAFGVCVCCCEDDWYAYEPEDNFFCGYGERIEE